MITPAYSSTATERVLPRMALDFTTASLDPRVTVTRALNTATAVNSSGYIETVNANLPRFDYTLGSGSPCKGLLIEETRINYCLQSVFANGGNVPSGWTLVLGTSGVSSASTILGTASGAYTFTAAANRQIIAQGGITASANTTYTVTVYVEANPDNNLASQMLSIVGNPVGSTVTAPTGTPAAGTRITATLVVGAIAGTFDFRLGIGVTGNATGTVRLSAPQIEAGAFPTSYIPTTTTSLTRNADAVSMTGTNFSSWYNATEGTFVVTGNIPFVGSTTRRFLSANDGTTNNTIQLAFQNSGVNGYFEARALGAVVVTASVGTVATNSFYTYALGYKLDNYAYSANASAPGTDTTAAVPTVTQLSIGYHTTSVWINGYISKISYFPQRLINAEIQAQSK